MPEEKKEKVFADGFFIEKKEIEKAPWVKASISITVAQAIPFLQKHEKVGGYVNLTLMESQKGGYYLELDQWKPKDSIKPEVKSPEQGPVPTDVEYPEEDINPDEIPF